MCVIRVSSKRKTLLRPLSDGVQLSSFGFQIWLQARHRLKLYGLFLTRLTGTTRLRTGPNRTHSRLYCKELRRKLNVLPCLSSLYFIKQAQFGKSHPHFFCFSHWNIWGHRVYSKRDFWFFVNFCRFPPAPPPDDAPPRPFEFAIAALFLSALVDPFTNWPGLPILGFVPSGAFPLSASCSFENFPFAFASRRACAAFSSLFFC